VSQTANDLHISVEEPAAWSRRLVITVPAERVRETRSRVTRDIGKRVRIPGFRKGKVPTDRLEAMYAADIDRQTQQRVIDNAFREAVRSKELEPISEPRVAKISYDRGSELTFEVAFDIRPEIKLARLGGFRIRRPEATVREEEVDEQLEGLRRQQATWKRAERKPTPGDRVEVEITPLEGEEAGRAKPYRFTLGEGRAIPDVESAITTLQAGEAGDFTAKFPEDFPDEERRGQSQRLHIELKQVLERELPELDDEFATSVGEFDDLAALRKAIEEDVRGYKEREADAQVDQQLIEQIIEANPFEVPQSMVDRYVDALVGRPEEADPELVERAREEARPTAEWGIKRTLIVQRVAEEQGFEASKEEVADRVGRIASRAGRPGAEVRAKLAKSGELRDLERRIVEEKVFGFLREQSEIQEAGS
jgi:trigger factor